jgi:hypothetical protein
VSPCPRLFASTLAVSFALIAALFADATGHAANSKRSTCPPAAAELADLLSKVSAGLKANATSTHTPSVRLTGRTKAARQGGKVHEVEVINLFLGEFSWESQHKIAPGAPQGDVRAFARALGENVAKFFGFEFSARKGWIPDADALNSAVEALNARLPEQDRIAWNFYGTSSTQPQIAPRPFLERYVSEGGIPIGEGDAIMIHDLAFHPAGILIPPRAVEHSRRQVATVLDFSDFLMTHWPDPASRAQASSYVDWLHTDAAQKLDSGTGNMSLAFSKEHLIRGAHREAYNEFTLEGRSPEEALTLKASEYEGKFKTPTQADKFKERLAEAIREYSAKRTDPEFRHELRMSEAQFLTEVHRRRVLFENAVTGAAKPKRKK